MGAVRVLGQQWCPDHTPFFPSLRLRLYAVDFAAALGVWGWHPVMRHIHYFDVKCVDVPAGEIKIINGFISDQVRFFNHMSSSLVRLCP